MTDAIQEPSELGNRDPPDSLDDRWGEYVPWFLRYSQAPSTGDFAKYFTGVGQ